MAASSTPTLVGLLQSHEGEILKHWLSELQSNGSQRPDRIPEREWRQQCGSFLEAIAEAARRSGQVRNTRAPEWAPVRGFLEELSRIRAEQGFSPSETATFIFSLKRPIFALLRSNLSAKPDSLADETWGANEMLDQLGLWVTDSYMRGKEAIIARQQSEVLELSTPVVRLWDGVLALPMIGTLDSSRTQVVMESLLEAIVREGAEVAIIDITGVPTVDTLVAQHLLKTMTAARLMGADCIISGIRPQIAQTIVHLGVDLGEVITKATLADAFQVALDRRGLTVKPKAG